MVTHTTEIIVVDTLNAIQNNLYAETLRKKGKAAFDDWTDYGVDIYLFMEDLKKMGFETVLVLGKEGSGKSFGMKTLAPGSFVWFNADMKNFTFKTTGDKELAKRLYGSKQSPGILQRQPTKYADIIKDCKMLQSGITVEDETFVMGEHPVAFLIGHTEEYKASEGEIKTRLKVLGKLATKMQIEGGVEHCYYSEMVIEGGKVKGRFRTQNSGSDTARSPEGMFEDLYIPNDYSLIFNAIRNY
ncbi:MAG TPA: hypothetical protein PKD00_03945 [Burkholderiales bacterium]|nr:hypothetical protein [Burkholderiales bacterium]